MQWKQDEILAVLDQCCETFAFPMLNNGYFYLAATRLSLYRSSTDWAFVFDLFGFSPREGLPGTTLQTFASRLDQRNTPEQYVNREGYEAYLANNPHNEFRVVWPIDPGPWQDAECEEYVAPDAQGLVLRGRSVRVPASSDYTNHGIDLEHAPRVQVFELCRCLAALSRNEVLATEEERRVNVPPNMEPVFQLEEWNHPDVCGDERPSGSETFRQLAEVLVSGNVARYRPMLEPNTHWRFWPEGGRL